MPSEIQAAIAGEAGDEIVKALGKIGEGVATIREIHKSTLTSVATGSYQPEVHEALAHIHVGVLNVEEGATVMNKGYQVLKDWAGDCSFPDILLGDIDVAKKDADTL